MLSRFFCVVWIVVRARDQCLCSMTMVVWVHELWDVVSMDSTYWVYDFVFTTVDGVKSLGPQLFLYSHIVHDYNCPLRHSIDIRTITATEISLSYTNVVSKPNEKGTRATSLVFQKPMTAIAGLSQG